jgi:hypothetical protein
VPRPTTPAAAVDPEITPAIPPRPWTSSVKWLVSAALLMHLTAQFLATWNAAPPASDLGQTLATPFQAYVAAARLNQGYRFFAPDPGPSHLMRFRIFDAEGKPVVLNEFALNDDRTEGQLPPPELRVSVLSPQARLLYHRYFMLTEQLDRAIPRPLAPNAPADEVAQQALRERAYRALTDSFARELLRRFGGASVKIQLLEHGIPRPIAFVDGMSLDDKRLDMFHPVTIEYPREKAPPAAPR